MKDIAQLTAALEAARAKRGYLLPHHGLFVLLSADFAEAYEAAYGRLALEPVALEAGDKEFAWLVILATVGSATARHHVRRFLEAGGDEAGVGAALRLAAFAAGRDRFDFAAAAWARHLPDWDAREAEASALAALIAGTGLSPRRVVLGLVAAATARRDLAGVRHALLLGYREGVAERDMAEAMCLTIQPAGLPNVVQAAGVWRALIAEGACDASAPFRAWAAMEAAGDGG
jgi:hypothetical protein